MTKTYTSNVTNQKITVKDLAGNTSTTTININNIDKTAPTLTIKYSPETVTKENVTATITANEQIQDVSGWTLSEDKNTLTKTYTENKTEKITVKDVAGNEAKITIIITWIEKETPPKSEEYIIEGDVIKNIQPNISYSDFIKNIDTNIEYTIKEGGKVITETDKIKTGQELIAGEHSYTIVVTGDANGDGKTDILDIMKINKHRLSKSRLTTVYLTAGDVNKDGKVDIMDIMKINKYRLRKINSL